MPAARAGDLLDAADGLPSDAVYDLCTDGSSVWALTQGGLCRIDAFSIGRVETPEAPRVPARIAVDEGGAVWLRMESRTWRREGEGVWRPAEGGPAALSGPSGAPIEFLGEVWTPTGQGIARERLRPLVQRYELPGTKNVNALAMGPDGSIWCGTENGVARVSGGSVEMITSLEGIELAGVTGCTVDREGRVWIGSGSTFTGTILLDAGRSTHLGGTDGFVDSYVHRIAMDPAGSLWFSVLNEPGGRNTEGGGAWVYSEGRFRRFEALLPSLRVYDVMARDPTGVLWFATLKGLAAFSGDATTLYGTEKGLLDERIWCLCAGRDGSLWVGYQQGFHGVTRLVRGEARHFTKQDGLCDDRVWSIVEGEPGVFWFATAGGLGRYDGKRWSSFGAEDGLGRQTLWPLLPMPDGSLWIGTLGLGLLHFSPSDDAPPRTFLEPAPARILPGESVTLRWESRDAWWEPSEDLCWRWRVDEGLWTEVSRSRAATVGGGPGRHRFEVQAIDRFGNAEDPPAAVEYTVEAEPRPFPWAWIAGGVAATAALGAIALLALRARNQVS